jgi:hypothetical protein
LYFVLQGKIDAKMEFSDRTRKIVELAHRHHFDTIILYTGIDSEFESVDKNNEVYDDESNLISLPKPTPISAQNAFEEPEPCSNFITLQPSPQNEAYM